MNESSVTTWIKQLQDGDNDVAQKLWERYLDRLTGLATDRMRNNPKRKTDEEDVVLSAFEEFRVKAGRGEYPKLNDREDLWQILVKVVETRAIDQFRREIAYQKRVSGESALQAPGASTSADSPIQRVSGREPTPDEAVAFADELTALLGRLDNDTLRAIVRLRLAGYSDVEIAQQLQCSLRTVECRLNDIRRQWADLVESR